MLRIISALIAIPIIMNIMYKGDSRHFLLLVLFTTAIASYEYFKIARNSRITKLDFACIIFSLAFPSLTYIYNIQNILIPLALIMIIFLTIKVAQGPKKKHTNNFKHSLFGILYIGVLISHFILLRKTEEGIGAVLFVLISIWTNDAAAYYFGKNIGKRRLLPSISPKKTIEGAVAGLLASGIGGMLLGFWVYHQLFITECIIAGILISIAGQLGDLGESLIKREYSVKDSGSLIPGHGGMLDRIDSLLFAAPVFYIYLHFLSL